MPKLNIDTRWIPQRQTVYVNDTPVKWVKHVLQLRAAFTPAPALTPYLSFSSTIKTMKWKLNIHTAWDTVDGPKPFDNESATIPVDGQWHILGVAPNEESFAAYAENYAPGGRTSLEDFIESKGYTTAYVDIKTDFSGTGYCTVNGDTHSAPFVCTLTSTARVEVVLGMLAIECQVVPAHEGV